MADRTEKERLCFACQLPDCLPDHAGCALHPRMRGEGERKYRKLSDLTPEQREKRRKYLKDYGKLRRQKL